MKGHTILVIVLTFISSYKFTVADWPVTASGCVKCNGEPMQFAQIKLYDEDDWNPDDLMGTAETKENGCFTVSGSGGDKGNGKPEPYIEVIFSYSGTYGQMEVDGRGENTETKSYAESLDFGTISISDIHCWAYVQFYRAMKDYKDRALMSLPYDKLTVKTNDGRYDDPYAKKNSVRIPKSLTISSLTLSKAKYYLALTVRHTYVDDYWRTKHSCGVSTDLEKAFNAGWAAFWAGECPGTYGSCPVDYTIEGNVANGLRKIRSCAGMNDAKMVNVLKMNPGKIFNFAEYNCACDVLYSCHT